MKIAIIGTGNIGGRLARLWLAQGRPIVLGLRTTDKIAAAQQKFPGCDATLIPRAVEHADVVVLAVPWPAVQPLLEELPPLEGRVLLDTTNPVLPDLSGLALPATTSAAEMTQKWQPTARVVKAFNTIGAAFLGNAAIDGIAADGFYCGDDADAKGIVAELIAGTGLAPQDVGPLRNARYLEAMAMLWIDMALHQHRGGRFGFKLLSSS